MKSEKYQIYLEKAEVAAQAERQKAYKEAEKMWQQAGRFAPTAEQREWAYKRSEFCERVARNPF